MQTSNYPISINRAIIYSTIAHLMAALFFIVAPKLGLMEHHHRTNITWINLPKGTSEIIQQNLKKSEDLPKSTIQEQKMLLEKPKSEAKKDTMKIATKEKKAPVKKKSEEDKKMEQALAKIDTQLKKRKVEVEAAQIKDSGEGYKYGTSDQPMKVAIDDPEYVQYQSMVRFKIVSEWIIPANFENDSSLNCEFTIFINELGDITSATLEKSSNNPSFDASARRAITKASPLPLPPDRLKDEVFDEGFLIEFNTSLKQ